MATYLSLVNDVVIRLREQSVSTVNETPYSTLIGKLVNDTKRQVENAWMWDALSTVKTVTTASGTSTYTVTGSGLYPRGADINDTTNNSKLRNVPTQWIIDRQQLSTVQNGNPIYYAWNGNDGTDSKIELYPTPNGTFSISINLTVPQAKLSGDNDVLTIPAEDAVVAGAYARALVERGEDGGLSSSEAFGLYKGILGDDIAMEANRFMENDCWSAV